MVSFFISVIVVCMVVGLLLWAIQSLPFIPTPMAQILRVVIIVVACLWLLSALLGHGNFDSLGFGHSVRIR